MLEKPNLRVMSNLGRARFSQLFKRIFLIAFLIMVVIVGIMQWVLFIQTRYLLDSELDKNNLQVLAKTQEILDATRKDAENLLLRITIDRDVNAFFTTQGSAVNTFQDVYLRKNITENMAKWLWDDIIQSIVIYAKETDRIISSDHGSSVRVHHPDSVLVELADELQVGSSKAAYTLYERKRSNAGQQAPVQCITLLCRRATGMGQYGYCYVNIAQDSLQMIVQQSNPDALSDLMLADAKGIIFLDTSAQHTGGHLADLNLTGQQIEAIMSAETGAFNTEINGGLTRLSWVKSSYDDMRYLHLVPYSHYARLLNHLVYTTLITLLCGSVVVLLASYALARYAYRPIRLLTHAVDNPSSDPESIRADEETRYILMKLLLANDKNIQLEQEKVHQFEVLRRAQANVLQAQITPHFLYNALQAIQMMILLETGNPHSEAAEAVVALSGITRSILQKGVDTVTLREELNYLEKYIYLKKLSYQDRLQVEFDVPEDVMHWDVPKLCLQPLLENVILHGMADRNVCIARIRVRMEKEQLIISMDDNGPGMSKEQMEDFNQLTSQEVIFRNQHVGLINLAQRLKLLYGDESGMKLSESDLGGLCVAFSLPCKQEAE